MVQALTGCVSTQSEGLESGWLVVNRFANGIARRASVFGQPSALAGGDKLPETFLSLCKSAETKKPINVNALGFHRVLIFMKPFTEYS
jgi:hypothetical protein